MLEAPIIEVFSSFQGEGILVGKRQIFIRFAGCNLNCTYCDTESSQDIGSGILMSVDELADKVESVMSPDFHSLSFTGGEPLLYADFIRAFLDKYDYPSMIETNGTLPGEMDKLKDKIRYASVDIKIDQDDEEINYGNMVGNVVDCEIKTLQLLSTYDVTIYYKIVVFPTTSIGGIEKITEKIVRNTGLSACPVIIQPASPIELWAGETDKLFKISSVIGDYVDDVMVIPQVHKMLDIE